MLDYVNGSFAGTGAAINKDIGFVPSRVKIINPNTNSEVLWTDEMGAGRGIKKAEIVTGLLTKCQTAIGSTPANVATPAFEFQILGTKYYKAAVAAGTAPTATTIPQNKYGLFGYEIGADGTIDSKDAAGNATGYATAAAAIAALPAASASHVLIGYVVVMSTDGGGFVGATTSFADAAVTATYYSASLALFPSTGLITSLDSSSGRGFTLGTDANINVNGDTLYFEAWR